MDKWDVRSITEMITLLGFFCAIFFAYYYYLKFRNQERKLLIEKDIDLSLIYKRREINIPWYIIGFALLGVSLGFVFTLLITFKFSGANPSPFLIAGGLLFGSIGIIVGHKLEQKKKKLRG